MSVLKIRTSPCQAGEILPLLDFDANQPVSPCAHLAPGRPQTLSAGVRLAKDGQPLFQVIGSVFLPYGVRPVPLLRALTRVEPGDHDLEISKNGYSLAVITLSDKGFAGQREDRSGPAIADLLAANLELDLIRFFLLPDDPGRLRALALDLAHNQGFDLLVGTGGTGLAPRDLSPEALAPILDKRLPGFEQAMFAYSLGKTAHAMLSRLLAGTIGQSLILALPGSRKAVLENLEAVLPALPHTLAKLHGGDDDCGG